MARRVAIIGTGQTKYVTKRRDVSFPELAHEAARKALDDAGLTLNDVDAVVFGSGPDAFEGVNCPDKWSAGAVGALNKPFMRFHTGGATGGSTAIAAAHHVASGLFDVVLAVAAERVGESPDAQRILNAGFPPIFAKDFDMNIITSQAMEAARWMKDCGLTEWHMAKIAVKNHNNALNNPYAHLRVEISFDDVLDSRMICWPLKLLDVCPRSDGACAAVFASEDSANKINRRAAWVKGMGTVTRFHCTGEPDLPKEVELATSAAWKAYRMAGIHNPRKEIQVVEPYTPFSMTELMDYVELGFCEKHELAKLCETGFGEMTGEVPFNPSGGVMCSNPIGASALVRVVEAALQVMGRAEGRQVENVRTALAEGRGGSPGPLLAFFQTAMILGAEPG